MTPPTENLAAPSGTFTLGGDLPVVRLGYGTMQLTGDGIWGPPKDHDEAIRVLRRAASRVDARDPSGAAALLDRAAAVTDDPCELAALHCRRFRLFSACFRISFPAEIHHRISGVTR